MSTNKIKIIVEIILIITGAGVGVYFLWENFTGIKLMLSQGTVEQVVEYIRSWGIWAPLLSILLMILQSVVAPIPAFLITGANGIIFGFWGGVGISWIGAMLGGLLSFYLARWFEEVFVKKMITSQDLWEKVNQISTKHGFKIVLIGRLLPLVSFDLVSYAAGLSTMRAAPFLVATGIGMIPGTIAYVLLGSQITRFDQYTNIAVVIVVLVTFIFGLYKFYKKKWKKVEKEKTEDEN